MLVAHDCWSRFQNLYPERGYRISRGGVEAFLIWDGYFNELMRAMSDDPVTLERDEPLPLFRDWIERRGCFGNGDLASNYPDTGDIADAMRSARRCAVAAVAEPMMPDPDADAFLRFLGHAAAENQELVFEEWW